MRRALDQYLDKAIAMKLAQNNRKDPELELASGNEEIFTVEISKEDLVKGTELYSKMP
jgi:hypothetical protein